MIIGNMQTTILVPPLLSRISLFNSVNSKMQATIILNEMLWCESFFFYLPEKTIFGFMALHQEENLQLELP